MTADGPPRCLWRIRDCALSCRLFPFAGGGLRFCNIVEAPRDSGGAFFFAVLLFGLYFFCAVCLAANLSFASLLFE